MQTINLGRSRSWGFAVDVLIQCGESLRRDLIIGADVGDGTSRCVRQGPK